VCRLTPNGYAVLGQALPDALPDALPPGAPRSRAVAKKAGATE
jgi:hypothetical protein